LSDNGQTREDVINAKIAALDEKRKQVRFEQANSFRVQKVVTQEASPTPSENAAVVSKSVILEKVRSRYSSFRC
jgi:hypothetical protein